MSGRENPHVDSPSLAILSLASNLTGWTPPGTLTVLFLCSASAHFPMEDSTLTLPSNFSSPDCGDSADQDPGGCCVGGTG